MKSGSLFHSASPAIANASCSIQQVRLVQMQDLQISVTVWQQNQLVMSS